MGKCSSKERGKVAAKKAAAAAAAAAAAGSENPSSDNNSSSSSKKKASKTQNAAQASAIPIPKPVVFATPLPSPSPSASILSGDPARGSVSERYHDAQEELPDFPALDAQGNLTFDDHKAAKLVETRSSFKAAKDQEAIKKEAASPSVSSTNGSSGKATRTGTVIELEPEAKGPSNLPISSLKAKASIESKPKPGNVIESRAKQVVTADPVPVKEKAGKPSPDVKSKSELQETKAAVESKAVKPEDLASKQTSRQPKSEKPRVEPEKPKHSKANASSQEVKNFEEWELVRPSEHKAVARQDASKKGIPEETNGTAKGLPLKQKDATEKFVSASPDSGQEVKQVLEKKLGDEQVVGSASIEDRERPRKGTDRSGGKLSESSPHGKSKQGAVYSTRTEQGQVKTTDAGREVQRSQRGLESGKEARQPAIKKQLKDVKSGVQKVETEPKKTAVQAAALPVSYIRIEAQPASPVSHQGKIQQQVKQNEAASKPPSQDVKIQKKDALRPVEDADRRPTFRELLDGARTIESAPEVVSREVRILPASVEFSRQPEVERKQAAPAQPQVDHIIQKPSEAIGDMKAAEEFPELAVPEKAKPIVTKLEKATIPGHKPSSISESSSKPVRTEVVQTTQARSKTIEDESKSKIKKPAGISKPKALSEDVSLEFASAGATEVPNVEKSKPAEPDVVSCGLQVPLPVKEEEAAAPAVPETNIKSIHVARLRPDQSSELAKVAPVATNAYIAELLDGSRTFTEAVAPYVENQQHEVSLRNFQVLGREKSQTTLEMPNVKAKVTPAAVPQMSKKAPLDVPKDSDAQVGEDQVLELPQLEAPTKVKAAEANEDKPIQTVHEDLQAPAAPLQSHFLSSKLVNLPDAGLNLALAPPTDVKAIEELKIKVLEPRVSAEAEKAAAEAPARIPVIEEMKILEPGASAVPESASTEAPEVMHEGLARALEVTEKFFEVPQAQAEQNKVVELLEPNAVAVAHVPAVEEITVQTPEASVTPAITPFGRAPGLGDGTRGASVQAPEKSSQVSQAADNQPKRKKFDEAPADVVSVEAGKVEVPELEALAESPMSVEAPDMVDGAKEGPVAGVLAPEVTERSLDVPRADNHEKEADELSEEAKFDGPEASQVLVEAEQARTAEEVPETSAKAPTEVPAIKKAKVDSLQPEAFTVSEPAASVASLEFLDESKKTPAAAAEALDMTSKVLEVPEAADIQVQEKVVPEPTPQAATDISETFKISERAISEEAPNMLNETKGEVPEESANLLDLPASRDVNFDEKKLDMVPEATAGIEDPKIEVPEPEVLNETRELPAAAIKDLVEELATPQVEGTVDEATGESETEVPALQEAQTDVPESKIFAVAEPAASVGAAKDSTKTIQAPAAAVQVLEVAKNSSEVSKTADAQKKLGHVLEASAVAPANFPRLEEPKPDLDLSAEPESVQVPEVSKEAPVAAVQKPAASIVADLSIGGNKVDDATGEAQTEVPALREAKVGVPEASAAAEPAPSVEATQDLNETSGAAASAVEGLTQTPAAAVQDPVEETAASLVTNAPVDEAPGEAQMEVPALDDAKVESVSSALAEPEEAPKDLNETREARAAAVEAEVTEKALGVPVTQDPAEEPVVQDIPIDKHKVDDVPHSEASAVAEPAASIEAPTRSGTREAPITVVEGPEVTEDSLEVPEVEEKEVDDVPEATAAAPTAVLGIEESSEVPEVLNKVREAQAVQDPIQEPAAPLVTDANNNVDEPTAEAETEVSAVQVVVPESEVVTVAESPASVEASKDLNETTEVPYEGPETTEKSLELPELPDARLEERKVPEATPAAEAKVADIQESNPELPEPEASAEPEPVEVPEATQAPAAVAVRDPVEEPTAPLVTDPPIDENKADEATSDAQTEVQELQEEKIDVPENESFPVAEPAPTREAPPAADEGLEVTEKSLEVEEQANGQVDQTKVDEVPEATAAAPIGVLGIEELKHDVPEASAKQVEVPGLLNKTREAAANSFEERAAALAADARIDKNKVDEPTAEAQAEVPLLQEAMLDVPQSEASAAIEPASPEAPKDLNDTALEGLEVAEKPLEISEATDAQVEEKKVEEVPEPTTESPSEVPGIEEASHFVPESKAFAVPEPAASEKVGDTVGEVEEPTAQAPMEVPAIQEDVSETETSAVPEPAPSEENFNKTKQPRPAVAEVADAQVTGKPVDKMVDKAPEPTAPTDVEGETPEVPKTEASAVLDPASPQEELKETKEAQDAGAVTDVDAPEFDKSAAPEISGVQDTNVEAPETEASSEPEQEAPSKVSEKETYGGPSGNTPAIVYDGEETALLKAPDKILEAPEAADGQMKEMQFGDVPQATTEAPADHIAIGAGNVEDLDDTKAAPAATVQAGVPDVDVPESALAEPAASVDDPQDLEETMEAPAPAAEALEKHLELPEAPNAQVNENKVEEVLEASAAALREVPEVEEPKPDVQKPEASAEPGVPEVVNEVPAAAAEDRVEESAASGQENEVPPLLREPKFDVPESEASAVASPQLTEPAKAPEDFNTRDAPAVAVEDLMVTKTSDPEAADVHFKDNKADEVDGATAASPTEVPGIEDPKLDVLQPEASAEPESEQVPQLSNEVTTPVAAVQDPVEEPAAVPVVDGPIDENKVDQATGEAGTELGVLQEPKVDAVDSEASAGSEPAGSVEDFKETSKATSLPVEDPGLAELKAANPHFNQVPGANAAPTELLEVSNEASAVQDPLAEPAAPVVVGAHTMKLNEATNEPDIDVPSANIDVPDYETSAVAEPAAKVEALEDLKKPKDEPNPAAEVLEAADAQDDESKVGAVPEASAAALREVPDMEDKEPHDLEPEAFAEPESVEVPDVVNEVPAAPVKAPLEEPAAPTVADDEKIDEETIEAEKDVPSLQESNLDESEASAGGKPAASVEAPEEVKETMEEPAAAEDVNVTEKSLTVAEAADGQVDENKVDEVPEATAALPTEVPDSEEPKPDALEPQATAELQSVIVPEVLHKGPAATAEEHFEQPLVADAPTNDVKVEVPSLQEANVDVPDSQTSAVAESAACVEVPEDLRETSEEPVSAAEGLEVPGKSLEVSEPADAQVEDSKLDDLPEATVGGTREVPADAQEPAGSDSVEVPEVAKDPIGDRRPPAPVDASTNAMTEDVTNEAETEVPSEAPTVAEPVASVEPLEHMKKAVEETATAAEGPKVHKKSLEVPEAADVQVEESNFDNVLQATAPAPREVPDMEEPEPDVLEESAEPESVEVPVAAAEDSVEEQAAPLLADTPIDDEKIDGGTNEAGTDVPSAVAEPPEATASPREVPKTEEPKPDALESHEATNGAPAVHAEAPVEKPAAAPVADDVKIDDADGILEEAAAAPRDVPDMERKLQVRLEASAELESVEVVNEVPANRAEAFLEQPAAPPVADALIDNGKIEEAINEAQTDVPSPNVEVEASAVAEPAASAEGADDLTEALEQPAPAPKDLQVEEKSLEVPEAAASQVDVPEATIASPRQFPDMEVPNPDVVEREASAEPEVAEVVNEVPAPPVADAPIDDMRIEEATNEVEADVPSLQETNLEVPDFEASAVAVPEAPEDHASEVSEAPEAAHAQVDDNKVDDLPEATAASQKEVPDMDEPRPDILEHEASAEPESNEVPEVVTEVPAGPAQAAVEEPATPPFADVPIDDLKIDEATYGAETDVPLLPEEANVEVQDSEASAVAEPAASADVAETKEQPAPATEDLQAGEKYVEVPQAANAQVDVPEATIASPTQFPVTKPDVVEHEASAEPEVPEVVKEVPAAEGPETPPSASVPINDLKIDEEANVEAPDSEASVVAEPADDGETKEQAEAADVQVEVPEATIASAIVPKPDVLEHEASAEPEGPEVVKEVPAAVVEEPATPPVPDALIDDLKIDEATKAHETSVPSLQEANVEAQDSETSSVAHPASSADFAADLTETMEKPAPAPEDLQGEEKSVEGPEAADAQVDVPEATIASPTQFPVPKPDVVEHEASAEPEVPEVVKEVLAAAAEAPVEEPETPPLASVLDDLEIDEEANVEAPDSEASVVAEPAGGGETKEQAEAADVQVEVPEATITSAIVPKPDVLEHEASAELEVPQVVKEEPAAVVEEPSTPPLPDAPIDDLMIEEATKAHENSVPSLREANIEAQDSETSSVADPASSADVAADSTGTMEKPAPAPEDLQGKEKSVEGPEAADAQVDVPEATPRESSDIEVPKPDVVEHEASAEPEVPEVVKGVPAAATDARVEEPATPPLASVPIDDLKIDEEANVEAPDSEASGVAEPAHDAETKEQSAPAPQDLQVGEKYLEVPEAADAQVDVPATIASATQSLVPKPGVLEQASAGPEVPEVVKEVPAAAAEAPVEEPATPPVPDAPIDDLKIDKATKAAEANVPSLQEANVEAQDSKASSVADPASSADVAADLTETKEEPAPAPEDLQVEEKSLEVPEAADARVDVPQATTASPREVSAMEVPKREVLEHEASVQPESVEVSPMVNEVPADPSAAPVEEPAVPPMADGPIDGVKTDLTTNEAETGVPSLQEANLDVPDSEESAVAEDLTGTMKLPALAPEDLQVEEKSLEFPEAADAPVDKNKLDDVAEATTASPREVPDTDVRRRDHEPSAAPEPGEVSSVVNEVPADPAEAPVEEPAAAPVADAFMDHLMIDKATNEAETDVPSLLEANVDVPDSMEQPVSAPEDLQVEEKSLEVPEAADAQVDRNKVDDVPEAATASPEVPDVEERRFEVPAEPQSVEVVNEVPANPAEVLVKEPADAPVADAPIDDVKVDETTNLAARDVPSIQEPKPDDIEHEASAEPESMEVPEEFDEVPTGPVEGRASPPVANSPIADLKIQDATNEAEKADVEHSEASAAAASREAPEDSEETMQEPALAAEDPEVTGKSLDVSEGTNAQVDKNKVDDGLDATVAVITEPRPDALEPQTTPELESVPEVVHKVPAVHAEDPVDPHSQSSAGAAAAYIETPEDLKETREDDPSLQEKNLEVPDLETSAVAVPEAAEDLKHASEVSEAPEAADAQVDDNKVDDLPEATAAFPQEPPDTDEPRPEVLEHEASAEPESNEVAEVVTEVPAGPAEAPVEAPAVADAPIDGMKTEEATNKVEADVPPLQETNLEVPDFEASAVAAPEAAEDLKHASEVSEAPEAADAQVDENKIDDVPEATAAFPKEVPDMDEPREHEASAERESHEVREVVTEVPAGPAEAPVEAPAVVDAPIDDMKVEEATNEVEAGVPSLQEANLEVPDFEASAVAVPEAAEDLKHAREVSEAEDAQVDDNKVDDLPEATAASLKEVPDMDEPREHEVSAEAESKEVPEVVTELPTGAAERPVEAPPVADAPIVAMKIEEATNEVEADVPSLQGTNLEVPDFEASAIAVAEAAQDLKHASEEAEAPEVSDAQVDDNKVDDLLEATAASPKEAPDTDEPMPVVLEHEASAERESNEVPEVVIEVPAGPAEVPVEEPAAPPLADAPVDNVEIEEATDEAETDVPSPQEANGEALDSEAFSVAEPGASLEAATDLKQVTGAPAEDSVEGPAGPRVIDDVKIDEATDAGVPSLQKANVAEASAVAEPAASIEVPEDSEETKEEREGLEVTENSLKVAEATDNQVNENKVDEVIASAPIEVPGIEEPKPDAEVSVEPESAKVPEVVCGIAAVTVEEEPAAPVLADVENQAETEDSGNREVEPEALVAVNDLQVTENSSEVPEAADAQGKENKVVGVLGATGALPTDFPDIEEPVQASAEPESVEVPEVLTEVTGPAAAVEGPVEEPAAVPIDMQNVAEATGEAETEVPAPRADAPGPAASDEAVEEKEVDGATTDAANAQVEAEPIREAVVETPAEVPGTEEANNDLPQSEASAVPEPAASEDKKVEEVAQPTADAPIEVSATAFDVPETGASEPATPGEKLNETTELRAAAAEVKTIDEFAEPTADTPIELPAIEPETEASAVPEPVSSGETTEARTVAAEAFASPEPAESEEVSEMLQETKEAPAAEDPESTSEESPQAAQIDENKVDDVPEATAETPSEVSAIEEAPFRVPEALEAADNSLAVPEPANDQVEDEDEDEKAEEPTSHATAEAPTEVPGFEEANRDIPESLPEPAASKEAPKEMNEIKAAPTPASEVTGTSFDVLKAKQAKLGIPELESSEPAASSNDANVLSETKEAPAEGPEVTEKVPEALVAEKTAHEVPEAAVDAPSEAPGLKEVPFDTVPEPEKKPMETPELAGAHIEEKVVEEFPDVSVKYLESPQAAQTGEDKLDEVAAEASREVPAIEDAIVEAPEPDDSAAASVEAPEIVAEAPPKALEVTGRSMEIPEAAEEKKLHEVSAVEDETPDTESSAEPEQEASNTKVNETKDGPAFIIAEVPTVDGLADPVASGDAPDVVDDRKEGTRVGAREMTDEVSEAAGSQTTERTFGEFTELAAEAPAANVPGNVEAPEHETPESPVSVKALDDSKAATTTPVQALEVKKQSLGGPKAADALFEEKNMEEVPLAALPATAAPVEAPEIVDETKEALAAPLEAPENLHPQALEHKLATAEGPSAAKVEAPETEASRESVLAVKAPGLSKTVNENEEALASTVEAPRSLDVQAAAVAHPEFEQVPTFEETKVEVPEFEVYGVEALGEAPVDALIEAPETADELLEVPKARQNKVDNEVNVPTDEVSADISPSEDVPDAATSIEGWEIVEDALDGEVQNATTEAPAEAPELVKMEAPEFSLRSLAVEDATDGEPQAAATSAEFEPGVAEPAAESPRSLEAEDDDKSSADTETSEADTESDSETDTDEETDTDLESQSESQPSAEDEEAPRAANGSLHTTAVPHGDAAAAADDAVLSDKRAAAAAGCSDELLRPALKALVGARAEIMAGGVLLSGVVTCASVRGEESSKGGGDVDDADESWEKVGAAAEDEQQQPKSKYILVSMKIIEDYVRPAGQGENGGQ